MRIAHCRFLKSLVLETFFGRAFTVLVSLLGSTSAIVHLQNAFRGTLGPAQ
jgi:hypothetical protein